MAKAWRYIGIAIAALLLATFVDRFVLVELLFARLAAPGLVAALICLAATGAGWLGRRLRNGAALNFAVGLPIFGAVCFIAGVVSVSTATMLPLVVAFAAAGAVGLWRGRAERHLLPPPAGASDWFGLLAVAVVIGCAVLNAQAPPFSLDELAYHLAVPQAWVAEGRAIALPLNSQSSFPLGVESASLPALVLLGAADGGTASHFVHLMAALAAIVLLLRRSRSWLVTAAIAATPALALTAGWSLADWPLLAICIAFLEEDDDTRNAALAAGLLTKYTFVPFAIVAIAVTRRWRGLWWGAAAGSLFFIRNLLLTGNPVAPFFSSLAPHVGGFRTLTLASYIFDGRFVDESLGASMFSLLPAISGPLAIALFATGALVWTTAPSARILVPFFGVAAAHSRVDASRLLRIVIAAAIAAQLLLVVYWTDRTQVFSLVSGKASEETFLASARPSYPTVRWIDSVLPARSRTLVVGLNESYWFSHRVRSGANFDGPRVSAYVDAPTPEALRKRLRDDGITHVAIVSAAPATAVQQKLEERETRLTPVAQRSLALMLDRYAGSVTSRGNAVVFALR